MQSKLRTSVTQHLLNPYERAMGVSIMRHRGQCRSAAEWDRVEHLRHTGDAMRLLMERFTPWEDAIERCAAETRMRI